MLVHLFHCGLSLKILSRWKLGSCICSHWLIAINSVALEVRILHSKPFVNSHFLLHCCRSSYLPSIHLQPFLKSHFHFPIFVESAEYQVISSFVRTSDLLRVIPVSSRALYWNIKDLITGHLLYYLRCLLGGGEGKGGQCILLTTVPPSCFSCLEILCAWTCPVLYWNTVTFTLYLQVGHLLPCPSLFFHQKPWHLSFPYV